MKRAYICQANMVTTKNSRAAYAQVERPREGDVTETEEDHQRKEGWDHGRSGNHQLQSTEENIS